MDKKEYEAPKMEIVEMPFGGILCGSGDGDVGAGEVDCTIEECLDDAF